MDDARGASWQTARSVEGTEAALSQIEKQFGRGAIMRLSDDEVERDIQSCRPARSARHRAGRGRAAARAWSSLCPESSARRR